MERLNQPPSVGLPAGSHAVAVERATKRRRLNNGAALQGHRLGDDDHPSEEMVSEGWPVSEDVVQATNNASTSPQVFRNLPSLPYPGGTLVTSFTAQERTHGPSDVPRREHEPPFSIVEQSLAGSQRETHRHSPADDTSNLRSDGGHDLPFGLLYNPRPPESAATNSPSGTDEYNRALPQQGADGFDAIDLTAVTDGPSLRQREELDDEARRMRRDASIKLEARRKANAQMLKSTLEQQQAETAKASDPGSDRGMGSLQCVICMDNFTDMTATHCGHLFCHTCINEHLITAELSRGYPSAKALCPFCRTPVYRKATRKTDKEKGVVPLIFKVKRNVCESNDKGKKRQVESVD